jgi:hypothetical protein
MVSTGRYWHAAELQDAEIIARKPTFINATCPPIPSSFYLHVHTRIEKFFVHRIRYFVDTRLHSLLRCCQASYYFRLPLPANFPVAGYGRRNILMPEVLAPRYEFFRRFADGFTQLDKCMPEAVRVEIIQPGSLKSLAENLAYRCRVAPMLSIQPIDLKL